MEVVDKTDGIKTEKVEDEVSFMLTNKSGAFCLMSHFAKSRFEGVFFRENGHVYKTISLFSHNSPVTRITNELWTVSREREHIKERFFMPMNSNSIIYELEDKSSFDLILDCKEIYDNREWGRSYEIEKEKGCLVIKFSKRNAPEEDNTKHAREFDIYTAVFSGDLEFKPVKKWEKHFYEFDKERDSIPFERHVFNACTIRCPGAAFAFSTDRKKAVSEAKYAWRNRKSLKKQAEIHVSGIIHRKDIDDNETAVAYQCALNAIDSLKIQDYGIMAGLPWFYQVWARDELISLKALINMGQYAFAKKVLFKYFDMIDETGKVDSRDIGSELPSADGILWLFKRFEDFIKALENDGLTKKYMSSRDMERLKEKLGIVISQWMKYHDNGGLIVNGPKETWMDTDFGGDSREGARIEINALFLSCLRLMRRLGTEEVFEKQLLKAVVKTFYDGKIIYDGEGDPTIRPNVFIAAYVYPELLTRKEWINAFEKMLPKIWLGWGGLSSIDKSNKLYTSNDTGENPKSYHRGDSWFWINNMAAIVLYRLDRKKFKKYIDKILKAGINEMLYSGVTGYSAEISSASEMKSQGCLCQAWSSALFVELIDEIYP